MVERNEYAASARSWTGGLAAPTDFDPEPGERFYLVMENVDLLELHDTLPPLMGGTSDFSLTGATAIAESASPVRSVWLQEPVVTRDTGTLVVTNLRVEFTGPDLCRVWPLDSLVDLAHDTGTPETWLLSTNHKRVSGFRYSQASTAHVRFCVAVALADQRGTREALAVSILREGRSGAAARAWRAARFVYTGKPGVRPAFRVTQGVAAGLLTIGLLGSVVPSSPDDTVNSSSARGVTASPSSSSETEQMAAEATAQAEQEAAARAAEAKAAADREAAAKLAAQREAAAKLEASRKLLAQRRAAAKAAAEKAAADKAAAEQAAAEAEAAQQTDTQADSGCTPEYPDFCIPIQPGDAYNCSDFSENDFTALPPDPYGLDRDNDGIACES